MARGVFCLEGDWWNDLIRPSSIEPTLRQLQAIGIRAIHRDVATRGEFEHYLQKWCQPKHKNYPILYLAFHGHPGEILIGDARKAESFVDLDSLEKALRGKCGGRVIYFGSCLTLDVHGARLNRFVRNTQAVAICGYSGEVDWILSAALDLIIFRELSRYSFTRQGMLAAEKRIFEASAGLARRLGFRMVIRAAR